jgi:OmcA/MtrC family decaheme c-type cytochrome
MTDKAFYADANTVNFVRPGLVVSISTASIADDGTVKVRFKVADPKGLPLDISGITSPGTISTRFVLGTIPAGQKQYTSYFTRAATDPKSGFKTMQATYDSGGTYAAVADGEYVYTFKGKAPAGFDKHATHSVGLWAARDLSEFDLTAVKNYDSTVYSWVPDGSNVVVTRDVIRTQSCEKCHTEPFTAHDERHGVELCVICHTPQTVDADTGNTVDMAVFIHKIHMGANLPSVKAGKPYQIIGYQQSVNDYSTVNFPADARNCTFCHEQNTGAAQADAYLKPTRAACGSCHDNVNFATGEGHLNLPQISDNQCAGCHTPQGELEFDASIKGAHTIPTLSRELKGTVFELADMKDTVAGKNPTVTFTMKDNAGNPITDISKMRVRIQLGGPASDYSTAISEDLSKAKGSGGTYTWTFVNAIPADAKGTWVMGLEAYRTVTIMAGTAKQQDVRDAALNKQYYISVDGSAVTPRRQVVATDKCNSCHSFLSLHGGNRNQVEECVICHNSTAVDGNTPADTIEFAYMIHRIHTGENGTMPYKIGSTDFSAVRYPGDRRNCGSCHVNGSEQLPLQTGLQNVNDPAGLLNPVGPATAACTGCHTDIASASHALSNTTDKLGEACAVCHSSTAEFSTSKVHAR